MGVSQSRLPNEEAFRLIAFENIQGPSFEGDLDLINDGAARASVFFSLEGEPVFFARKIVTPKLSREWGLCRIIRREKYRRYTIIFVDGSTHYGFRHKDLRRPSQSALFSIFSRNASTSLALYSAQKSPETNERTEDIVFRITDKYLATKSNDILSSDFLAADPPDLFIRIHGFWGVGRILSYPNYTSRAYTIVMEDGEVYRPIFAVDIRKPNKTLKKALEANLNRRSPRLLSSWFPPFQSNLSVTQESEGSSQSDSHSDDYSKRSEYSSSVSSSSSDTRNDGRDHDNGIIPDVGDADDDISSSYSASSFRPFVGPPGSIDSNSVSSLMSGVFFSPGDDASSVSSLVSGFFSDPGRGRVRSDLSLRSLVRKFQEGTALFNSTFARERTKEYRRSSVS